MTTTSATSPLPCPFCGEQPQVKMWPNDPYNLRGRVEVSCETPHCPVLVTVEENDLDEAVAHWNRRYSVSAGGGIDGAALAAWLKSWWHLDDDRRAARRIEFGPDIAHLMRGVADMIEGVSHSPLAGSAVADEINRVWAKICGGNADPVTDEALLVKRVKWIDAQLDCAETNFRVTNKALVELDAKLRAAQSPLTGSDAVRNALIDLVRLKDLKQWIEAGLPGADEATKADAKARYEREKEPAWEAARLALGNSTPSATTGITPLERYALAVLDAHREEIGDLDGAFLQDEAERCGLLYYVEVAEPCGDYCRCAEYDDFPQQCLRLKPEFEPKMAALRALLKTPDRTVSRG